MNIENEKIKAQVRFNSIRRSSSIRRCNSIRRLKSIKAPPPTKLHSAGRQLWRRAPDVRIDCLLRNGIVSSIANRIQLPN